MKPPVIINREKPTITVIQWSQLGHVENDTGAVATFTATDPEGVTPIVWSLLTRCWWDPGHSRKRYAVSTELTDIDGLEGDDIDADDIDDRWTALFRS